MRNPLSSFRIKFSATYAFWIAALAPPGIALFLGTTEQDLGEELLALIVTAAAVFALVTYRGRRLAGWARAIVTWLVRHRRPPDVPSTPVIGATVRPGDRVALRWEGRWLVAVVKVNPRPLAPTLVVDGRADTNDFLDTALLEHLLEVNCPDLQAEVVSAGYRVGRSAPREVVSIYARLIGRDPAPAYRRTWITLRADPRAAQRSALRRDTDVAGLARYLVASSTRIADQLAAHGVDATCESDFGDYDAATTISFKVERWSSIKGHGTYTAAYTAPGGPDAWWSAPARRTITRFRVAAGEPPRSAVFLTTATKPKRPAGFSRASGGQRDPLAAAILTTDRHRELPIGSAGILVGETANRERLYLPFDAGDASVTVGDARMFTQFAVRAAAAGATVTLPTEFGDLASRIGGDTGPEAKVTWPDATTYLGPQPGLMSVVVQENVVSVPGNTLFRIEPVSSDAEARYQQALPGKSRTNGATRATNGKTRARQSG